jgi:hypothetical protein
VVSDLETVNNALERNSMFTKYEPCQICCGEEEKDECFLSISKFG